MIRSSVPAVFVAGAMLGMLGCCVVENKMLYHPVRSDNEPLPDESSVQDVELRTANSTTIHARWVPHSESKGTVLYCPGNAGNLEMRGRAVRELSQALGESILIFDYPGFGKSEGQPSESGCYAAADAAYDWLVLSQGVAPATIVLYGESLGGGVAVELASRRPHRALVLVRTFTSVPDVAQSLFGWVPVHGLVTNQFDNLAKIALCKQPIFIAHADADRLMPFAHGQRLLEASDANATIFTLSGKGHNDPLSPEFYTALRHFLAAS